MATTYYYTVNGNLLGEATGGVETTYIPDALGSTTQTVTSAGVQNQYVYSPYGRLIAKSGTAADPKFLWNGRTQSRTTGCAYAEQYNRRRIVSTTTAQWTSVDPLWPTYSAYGYANQQPGTATDPMGYSVNWSAFGCKKSDLVDPILDTADPCEWFRTQNCIEASSACHKNVLACMSANGFEGQAARIEYVLSYFASACSANAGPSICIACEGKWPSICPDPCSVKGTEPGATSLSPYGPPPSCPKPPSPERVILPAIDFVRRPCQSFLEAIGCDCIITQCKIRYLFRVKCFFSRNDALLWLRRGARPQLAAPKYNSE